jgi:hypothetical protein
MKRCTSCLGPTDVLGNHLSTLTKRVVNCMLQQGLWMMNHNRLLH